MQEDRAVLLHTALFFRASSEVLGQESFSSCVELQAVLGTGETVTFVLEEQVLVVDPFLLHGGDYLLRLGLFYAWVVGPLGDEHRYPDAVDEEEGGAGLEEIFLGVWIADPLVEGREERLPVRRDAVYQGDQVRGTHDINSTPEEIWRERGPDEHGEPAVGAAVDGDPLGVGDVPLHSPPDRVNEVVVHPARPLLVPGVQELLAIPCRAPVIHLQACVPPVGEPLRLRVVAPSVPRPRTTVYIQHHRHGSGLAFRRQRQVSLYREAVAGGE